MILYLSMARVIRRTGNHKKENIIFGVYIITNLINNKIYIGSSSNGIYKRLQDHFDDLENNIHVNAHLQNAYNKYGITAFKTKILEICNKENCVKREQHYLDTLLFAQEFIKGEDKRFENLGYNICPVAGSPFGVVSKQRKKCILYTLGGEFHKICESHTEAILYAGVVTLKIIKSGKCGNYIVIDYFDNYPLRISPYKPVTKKCVIYNLQGEYISNFDSLKDAAKYLKCRSSSVSQAIKFKTGKHYDYIIKSFDGDFPLKIDAFVKSPRSQKTRDQISSKLKGKFFLTEEANNRRIETLRNNYRNGKKVWNKGKNINEEYRLKICAANIQKLSVLVLDISTKNVIKEFDSISDAGKYYNVPKATICVRCKLGFNNKFSHINKKYDLPYYFIKKSDYIKLQEQTLKEAV